MDEEDRAQVERREKGDRAENVATWYFRLNGFLSIPGFVVHPDRRQTYPRTEADLIAVRFPFSLEKIASRSMADDPKIIQPVRNVGQEQTLFVLVEVKTNTCAMNGPWSEPHRRNIQRVIRRLGFSPEAEVENIAAQVYQHARWENDHYALQYICVGRNAEPDLQELYSHLVQVIWKDIAAFLLRRFRDFPEKTPDGPMHVQWPDFGRQYAEWFDSNPRAWKIDDSNQAIERYIMTGCCKQ
jgi:hypothetical protein